MLGASRGIRIAGSRFCFATAAPQTSSQTPPIGSVPSDAKEAIKQFLRKKSFVPQLSSEQIKLQEKFGEKLQNLRFENLHDAAEFIEWRGTIYEHSMERILRLLADASKSKLSDRQLAVVLSAFGSACDTCSRVKRDRNLTAALQIIKKQGVKLGIQSANAVLDARLANNITPVNVVDELRQFEDAKLEPDERTFALLAEAYARQGNVKAIGGLISYMKESGMKPEEDHIVPMIYAIALAGSDEQANTAIESFSSKMNVVRLRCAAAQAAIVRNSSKSFHGAYEIVGNLRSIPTTAKMHAIDNNKYVLAVLMDLIEAGQADAFQLLSPYLALDEEGTHLSERHLNGVVVGRARQFLAEGKPMEAIILYAVVNPSNKNEFFEKELQIALTNALQNLEPQNFDAFMRLANASQNYGLIPNVSQFLLESGVESPCFEKIFAFVKSDGQLRPLIAKNPELKKHIARKLSHKMIESPPSTHASLFADIASVLFLPCKEGYQDLISYYTIMYKLGANDVKLALEAMPLIQDAYVRRECATAIFHQVLRFSNTDHLSVDKLLKLCSSPMIEETHAIRLHNLLLGFVKGRGVANDEHKDSVRLQIAAKILASDFISDRAGSKVNYGPENLVRFLANETISNGAAGTIVKILEADNRVGFTQDEIFEARRKLADQPQKAEMIGQLKKSQTLSRWRSANFNDLLEELKHLISSNAKIGIVNKLQEVILQRTLSEKFENVEDLVKILEQTSEWRKLLSNPREEGKGGPEKTAKNARGMTTDWLTRMIRKVESFALVKSLSSNDTVMADRIWQLRSHQLSVDALLLYASRLFLSGEDSRATEICNELRATAQAISPTVLDKLGRRLTGVNVEDLGRLATYLSKQFNLKADQTRRIALQVKLDQLNELIKKGEMDEALKMVAQETSSSKRAFGQLQLMAEAIRRKDMKLLSDVHTIVLGRHDQTVANFDLAYAFIDAGRVQQAKSLVESQNTEINDKTFKYFKTLAVSSKNASILHGLFTVFNGRASTLLLNELLETLTRLYYHKGDAESLRALEQEINASSFPLQQRLRNYFNDLKLNTADLESQAWSSNA